MTRKIIIDCSPGIGAAAALALALFDRRLEVLAVTACGGAISAEQATRNAQTVVDVLDPPRIPRLGVAEELAPPTKRDWSRRLNGENGLGNIEVQVSELHHQHFSDKLIGDIVRFDPHKVTILCLGPLTNLARAFQRDPKLQELVDQVVICGGVVDGGGDATMAAEQNLYADPESAQQVFRAPITKTLVPLDVTRQAEFAFDFVEHLPEMDRPAGVLLRKLFSFAFRAHRQHLGLESILLPEAVALAAVLHPELFETQDLAGDVETQGLLTRGASVLDRRRNVSVRPNMAVALEVETTGVADFILRGLTAAGS